MSPAEAFRRFAQAALDVAAAIESLESDPRPSSRRDTKPEKATKGVEAPKLDLATAKDLLDAVPDRDGLTKTETKILTALAQAGHALSSVQIGKRCGLSSTTGSFAQALAGLRSDGYIVGGGGSITITDEGLEALGPFARLPEGPALFDYWCHKTGGTCAKILTALRQCYRAQSGPATSAELGAATGLSHSTGSFAQALAKLRKLELIQGGGTGMLLAPELQRAVEPTIGVFDRQSGKTVRVDRSGTVAR